MKRIAQCVLALAMGSTSIATAATLNPSSYDMVNGSAGGGGARLDNTYNGSGDNTVPGALLTGGLGDLTDGVIPAQGFILNETPYVGWALAPLIAFHFSGPLTIQKITFYVDDANQAGVDPPASIDVRLNGGAFTNFVVDDPVGTAPFAIQLSGLSLTSTFGDTLLETRLNPRVEWVFLSEAQFAGSLAAIPEPSTYALMLGGLGLVGWVARRRRRDNA